MTPQEQELLSTFLDNLGRAQPDNKDADAEAMIRRAVARQPDAAYILVQQALLQEIALRNAQARIADLEAQLRKARGGNSAGASSGSFLGGAGPARPSQGRDWINTPPPPNEPPSGRGGWTQPAPAQGAMPGGQIPGQGFLGRGGQPSAMSGFLSSAAATAAGVAGGALLFQGLEHLIGGSHLSGLGTGLGTGTTPVIEETVINEYGNEPAADKTAQDRGENYADAADTGQDLGDDYTDTGDSGGGDGSNWT
jgi:hypothetical protein